MNWTTEKPSEGLYWYRTKPDNGVLMKVEWYEDRQSGRASMVAAPQLPFHQGSTPVLEVRTLVGEWAPATD